MRNVGRGRQRKERRKLPRNIIQVRQYLVIYFEQEVKASARAILIDLTRKGAGLFSEVYIPPGTEVVLEFKLKNVEDDILIPCRITWSEKVPSTNRIIKIAPHFSWHFGVCFEAKTDEEKLCIQMLNDELTGKERKQESDDEGSSSFGAMPVPQGA